MHIPSHVALTQKQKEQLDSFPNYKFTDTTWESQNDAASFMSDHNLENNQERKWKVRYSYKAKGIRNLQCSHGIDMSSRRANSSKKTRRSRQSKFVGCLAFARIKKYKDNRIRISGYLNHSMECQQQQNVLDNRNNETKNDVFESQININNEFVDEYENNKLCNEPIVFLDDNISDQYIRFYYQPPNDPCTYFVSCREICDTITITQLLNDSSEGNINCMNQNEYVFYYRHHNSGQIYQVIAQMTTSSSVYGIETDQNFGQSFTFDFVKQNLKSNLTLFLNDNLFIY
ncbi:hypothetical protein RclHR1_13870005 [Rhizophagus clarus]|nr:hypothetical protein RclHR1_13870005 [Rhizophagus clarus]